MDLQLLYDVIPSWEWPKDAGRIFKDTLENHAADAADRLLAAEMAGDPVAMNDDLARTLIAIVGNSDEPAELRATAAVSFGPAFEFAYIYEFDDPDDIILTEKTYLEMQAALTKLYHDAGVPVVVRQNILQAIVRAPQDWHSGEVRAAYASNDEDWRLTAVFCMRFIKGFEREILEALESADQDIRYQAISAAGNWGLEKAWPSLAGLFTEKGAEKAMLLAAIEAAAGIGTPEALDSLRALLDSDDGDVVDAVWEALAMLREDGLEDEFE